LNKNNEFIFGTLILKWKIIHVCPHSHYHDQQDNSELFHAASMVKPCRGMVRKSQSQYQEMVRQKDVSDVATTVPPYRKPEKRMC
jgi:hypothetical protein